MYEIVRVYVTELGVEKCFKAPAQIISALLSAMEPLDLDYHDERGHAHMGTSDKFAGKTVKVGEQEIQIPIH